LWAFLRDIFYKLSSVNTIIKRKEFLDNNFYPRCYAYFFWNLCFFWLMESFIKHTFVYLNMQEETSLRIKRKTIEKLEEMKIHPRQSYDEVIGDLISSSQAIQLNLNKKAEKNKK